MYIGPYQDYNLHLRQRREQVAGARNDAELSAIRERIVVALQQTLDPLTAQLAMDAVHPVLDLSTSKPILQLPKLKPSRRDEDSSILSTARPVSGALNRIIFKRNVQVGTDGPSPLRSRSEPISLMVKKKIMTSKNASLQLSLPPLSLPPLVDKRQGNAAYDSEAMVGLLRLTRRRGIEKKPTKLKDAVPVKLAPKLDKSKLLEDMRRRYLDNRLPSSAMTDSDPLEPMDTSELGYEALAEVSKYFIGTSPSPSSGEAVELGQTLLSPLIPSYVEKIGILSTSGKFSDMGDEGLLRWSISLDVGDLESLLR
jgi:hypothetical protein